MLHLWLNGTDTPFWDVFFRYYTMGGEWIPYLFVAALMLYRFGWGLFSLLSVALSGLCTYAIKHLFYNYPRPWFWFEYKMPEVQLHFARGIMPQGQHSFPSGHTTTFFALFLTLALLVEHTNLSTPAKRLLQTLFFALACLGGYSRIYLNMHFAIDVLVGSMIGTLLPLLLYALLSRYQSSAWWQFSLQCLFTRRR